MLEISTITGYENIPEDSFSECGVVVLTGSCDVTEDVLPANIITNQATMFGKRDHQGSLHNTIIFIHCGRNF